MVVLKSIQTSYDWAKNPLPNYTRGYNEEQMATWRDKQENRYDAMTLAIKCVRACKAVNEIPSMWQKAMRAVSDLDDEIEKAMDGE